jgi:predicted nuclease of predicted toxin-antitoxin system
MVLLDMNLSPSWVTFLEQAGFQAVHWSDVGDPRASDEEVMEWARARKCVLFTHDMDFGALLAATRARGPSVLQVRVKDTMPQAIGRDVVRVLRMRRDALERGALVTVDAAHSRVSVLPIRGEEDPR